MIWNLVNLKLFQILKKLNFGAQWLSFIYSVDGCDAGTWIINWFARSLLKIWAWDNQKVKRVRICSDLFEWPRKDPDFWTFLSLMTSLGCSRKMLQLKKKLPVTKLVSATEEGKLSCWEVNTVLSFSTF